MRRLTEELKKRGVEADLVSMPLVERERFDLVRGALGWRSLDLTEVGGRAGGRGDRDALSDVRDPASAQGRVADPPVPAGVRPVRHGIQRPDLFAGGPAHAGGDRAHRPGRSLRSAQGVRELADRGRAAEEVQRDRERAPVPPAAARGPIPKRPRRRHGAVGRPARRVEAAGAPAAIAAARARGARRAGRARPRGGKAAQAGGRARRGASACALPGRWTTRRCSRSTRRPGSSR